MIPTIKQLLLTQKDVKKGFLVRMSSRTQQPQELQNTLNDIIKMNQMVIQIERQSTVVGCVVLR